MQLNIISLCVILLASSMALANTVYLVRHAEKLPLVLALAGSVFAVNGLNNADNHFTWRVGGKFNR
ncbi:MAG TPA: hypothetical protein VIN66_05845 [Rheinheimera sp.]|uniref:hypothetical protein n=1 Tax=Rheinheimera sp. TaxID=1869214 RepID=UPI002F94775F